MAEPSKSRPLVVVAAGLLVTGAVLRVLASLTDFWLDEILTLDWPHNYGYWELIADPRTRHDNNHVLNSWWLKLVETWGEPDHWFPYRLWSIVTGVVGSVAMACIGWRRSAIEGVFAAGFGALSYVMIHYSSECRGYASVCCFATLSWLVVERAFRRPGWGSTVAFAACAVLGVLSHSTYAFVYIAICVWSVAAWRAGSPGATIVNLVELHVFPFAFLALIYFARIRGMTIGGGPEFGLERVMINTLAHAVGWAWTRDWVGYAYAYTALALIAVECGLRAWNRRKGDASWVFFAALLVVTPLLTALWLKPRIVFMRYFLVCMPFLMLLVAGLAARGWRGSRFGRIAAVVLLLAILAHNAWRIHGLLRAGRGQYLAALQTMVALDEGDKSAPITIRGDEELHIRRIVGYYNRFLARRVVYDKREHPFPDWLISELQVPLPKQVNAVARYGTYYTLRGRFEYASTSGAHWYIFQRDH